MAYSYISPPYALRLIARIALSMFMAFSCTLVCTQVTDLPPLPKPQKDQQRSGADVRSGSQISPAEKKRAAPTNELNSESSSSKSELSAADRALIEKACRSSQYSGPAAFHDCERRQVTAAKKSTPVSFDGVSSSDKMLIEKACRSSQYSGPAAFHDCERRQVVNAKNSPKVSFDGVSGSDQSMIEKACRSSQYSGPAAYRSCQRNQVSQLKSSQTSRSAGK